MEKKNPVVYLVAWLIERNQAARAKLVDEVERQKLDGDAGGKWRGWKAFVLYYSDRYPLTAAFFPFAVCLYLFTFFQIMGG